MQPKLSVIKEESDASHDLRALRHGHQTSREHARVRWQDILLQELSRHDERGGERRYRAAILCPLRVGDRRPDDRGTPWQPDILLRELRGRGVDSSDTPVEVAPG